eukprot:CAMPEP_0194094232 /NCGR_PEP_ID=MMETSP0149-20130528/53257_1 /TAXON_ID=122233 /ORGANISM="Chaetoceros debilis, Strain MM31A-1" /LENGTH=66 /DNA_ID=CAMNT_0038779815 /DNA_START=70 /DNA_END=267 /DNA_ORIENTATION=+
MELQLPVMLSTRKSIISVRVKAVSVAMEPKLSMMVPALDLSHWISFHRDLAVGSAIPSWDALAAFA